MSYVMKVCLCVLSAFIASVVIFDNSGIGTLGEWAGAIASFGAIMVALRGNKAILKASFISADSAPLFTGGIGIEKDLFVIIENESNFDVQADTITVMFKTRFLKRKLGEYLVEKSDENTIILPSHKIYKSQNGFSVIGKTLPVSKHKMVLADVVIYYANKRTFIKVNQLVDMDLITAKKPKIHKVNIE